MIHISGRILTVSTAAVLRRELHSKGDSRCATVVVPSVLAPEIDHEVIARVAYRYWEDRQAQGVAGSAEDDWLQAERDLRMI